MIWRWDCKVHIRDSYAVTEVLGIIIIVIIATSAIAFVTFWAVPQMDAKKISVRIDSALTQFKTIAGVIQDVTDMGVNGSKFVDFVIDAGQVSLDPVGERFVLYYSLTENFDFNVSGLGDSYDKQFNFKIEKGTADSLTVYYIYNGGSEIILSPFPVPPNPITVSNNLADTIKIDVKEGSNIVGRIWLFDSGSISYDAGPISGTYEIATENGGVASLDSSGDSYLHRGPSFYSKDDSITMKMIQLKPGGRIVESGKNKYTFIIKSNATYVRETETNIGYGGFKMQTYGSYNESWIRYFTTEQSFRKFSNKPDTLWLPGNRIFTLVNSICNVKFVV